jgi:AbiV family abortive infection protein
MSSKTINYKKIQRLASEAFKNAIRLHLDSIVLFNNKSYASSFQLSVLSMEEMAKAKEIENYYFHTRFNKIKITAEQEIKWLERFHIHTAKQYSFVARDLFEYSPKYVIGIKKNLLEEKKQKATYVGLKKVKGKIDPKSKVSSPLAFKEKDSKTQISIINDELLWLVNINLKDSFVFLIDEMNNIMGKRLLNKLKKWRFKSKIRSAHWDKQWRKGIDKAGIDLQHRTWMNLNAT